MIFESKSVLETYKIADKILTKIKPGSVVALLGDLGTGKTTFTQGFAKALKLEDLVGSPTFKLVSEYDCNPYKMYHIDVYRLKNSSEFLNIGGEEYLSSKNSYTLIEWADIIKDILPLDTIKIELSRIKEDENMRKINVKGLNDGF